MTYKKVFTNSPIKMKSGYTIRTGSQIEIAFEQIGYKYGIHLRHQNNNFKVSLQLLKKLQGIKQPSIKTLQKWEYNGISKSVFGKTVEPDGHDEYGSPSWTLLLIG